MTAIDPDLVEKLLIAGASTDPDGSLQNKTVPATDTDPPEVPDSSQTVGFIQVRNVTQLEGVKVTWDSGHGDLTNSDTISIFLHSLGTFPPATGDTFSCMPYITANTVDPTSSNWLEVSSPTSNAFNVFTMTTAFRAALVDLGSGKFSVRIIIDSPVSPVRRFGRWNEIDSDLTQPGGGKVFQGDPDDMFGVAILDVFAGVKRDSGVVSAPDGILGTATVASQGGTKRDSGSTSPLGVAVVAAQGGAKRDSGSISMTGTATIPLVVAFIRRGGTSSMTGVATMLASGQKVGATEIPGNPEDMFGKAIVASSGGVKRDSGAIAMTGVAVTASAGGAKRDSGAIAMTGVAVTASEGGAKRDSGAVSMTGVAVVASSGELLPDVLIDNSGTFPLEVPNQSVNLISDGNNWWVIYAHRPTFEQRGTTSEPGQFRAEQSTVGNSQSFPVGTIVALAENGDARFPELVLGKTFESVVATGTAPFTVASTTVVANLNAATLAGSVKGTSGSTIPLLDAANTWSADQLLGTTTKLTLDNSSQYLHAPTSLIVKLNSVGTIVLALGGTEKAALDGTGLDVVNSVIAEKFISDVADGTEPYATTSLFLNTNLNADLLDGKHVGTSGDTVPLLGTAQTWSGVQTFGTSTKQQFRDSANYIYSPSTDILTVNAGTITSFSIDGTIEMFLGFSGLDVANSVIAEKFISDVADGTVPYATTSTTLCTNLNADRVDSIEAAEFVQRDGSIPLTADWDVGSFTVRAVGFIADGDSGSATSGAIEYTGTTVAADTGTPTFPALITGGVTGGVGWLKIYVTAGAVYVPYWR